MTIGRVWAAVTVAAAFSFAGCGGSQRPDTPSSTRPPSRGALSSVHIFTRPRTARDRIPSGVIPSVFVTDFGVDASRSRLAVDEARLRLYAVPGDGWGCLISTDKTLSNCWRADVIAAGQAVGAVLCAASMPTGVYRLAGIVPNGIRSVAIQNFDGSYDRVPVTQNVYAIERAHTAPVPRTVNWRLYGRLYSAPAAVLPVEVRRSCERPPS